MSPDELALFEVLVEKNTELQSGIQELAIEIELMRRQHETQMRELWHHFNNTVDMVADIVRPLVPSK